MPVPPKRSVLPTFHGALQLHVSVHEHIPLQDAVRLSKLCQTSQGPLHHNTFFPRAQLPQPSPSNHAVHDSNFLGVSLYHPLGNSCFISPQEVFWQVLLLHMTPSRRGPPASSVEAQRTFEVEWMSSTLCISDPILVITMGVSE